MEHSYQPVLFVEDSWTLNNIAIPPNGNSFEMYQKEKLISSLQIATVPPRIIRTPQRVKISLR